MNYSRITENEKGEITMNTEITLNHFFADKVVNTTSGAMENGTITDADTLTPEMKKFYDKTLITLAGANLVHEQFGQQRNIPKNGGKTVSFRRFSKLPKAMKAITEGVTPGGSKLQVSEVECTIDQYGDYIEQTDMLELTAVDNTIVEATKELASQAGLTLDTVVRNELVGGTNVMYVPKIKDGNTVEIYSRKDITPDCRFRVKDVFRAAAELKAVNAPKINGSYVAVIHPYVAYDLMQDAGEQWIGIQKYADPENILRGEIGMLGGVRFVESTEAKIFAPKKITDGFSRLAAKGAAAETDTVKVSETLTPVTFDTPVSVYVNGVENTVVSITNTNGESVLTLGTKVANIPENAVICGTGGGKDGSAVFCTLFIAANAYGVTSIEGGGLEHIVKQRGYGNDPLNQRSSVGWKATKVAKRLLEEHLIRVESGSEFSPTAEEN